MLNTDRTFRVYLSPFRNPSKHLKSPEHDQEIQRMCPVTLLVVFTGPSSPWNAR